jgi:hypothetical protein
MAGTSCISGREKQMMICGFQIEESELLTATFFASTGKKRKAGDPLQLAKSARSTLAKAVYTTLNGAGGARVL